MGFPLPGFQSWTKFLAPESECPPTAMVLPSGLMRVVQTKPGCGKVARKTGTSPRKLARLVRMACCKSPWSGGASSNPRGARASPGGIRRGRSSSARAQQPPTPSSS